MASIKQEISRQHRELKPLLEIYEKYAYRFGYYKVFEDFIDFCIAQYCPFIEYKLPDYIKQPDNDRNDFVKMIDVILKESRLRCNIWTNEFKRTKMDDSEDPLNMLTDSMNEVLGHMGRNIAPSHDWYDPFGSFYETVANNFTKSYKGQFFTPITICDFMAKLVVTPTSEERGAKVCEPCCGSGRMVLAANAINPSNYHVANDIDSLCAKMTAVNYCINGVVGEITCNDGLWATKDNFRFGYKCVPLGATAIGQNKTFAVWSFLSKSIRNQFILIPLEYEQCMYSKGMNQSLSELTRVEAKRREDVAPGGMQGLLFEAEMLDKKTKTKPSQRIPKEDKNNDSSPLTLF